jgi:hypothetical protein
MIDITPALYYLLRIVPIVVASLIFAEFIVELGLTRKVGFLFSPLTKFAHLREECGAALTIALVSPLASSSMLMDFYTKDIISKRELIIASLTRSFPGIISEARYMLPTILPLLGLVGLCYYGFWVIISFCQTLIASALGRKLLRQQAYQDCEAPQAKERKELKAAFRASLRNAKKPIKRVLIFLIPAVLIAFILKDVGVFDAMAQAMQGIIPYLPIPVEGMAIIAAQFAHAVAGYAVAGALLTQGVLGAKEVIVSLLLGSILAFPIRLRFLFTHYFGIFGPKLGTEIMALSVLLRTVVTVAIIAAIMVLW